MLCQQQRNKKEANQPKIKLEKTIRNRVEGGSIKM
jgi:hypothetical protein